MHIFITLLLLTFASSALRAETPYSEMIKGFLPGLATNDAVSLKTLETAVHTAGRPGAEAERLACCKALTGALGIADTPPRVKAFLLRQLQLIGKEESVPTLVQLLADSDPHVAAYARAALSHNPACPEQYKKQFATEALNVDQQDPDIAGDRELQQAWRLLKENKTAEASAAFGKLSKTSPSKQVRFAASRGTLAAAGDAAVPLMVEMLAGADPDNRKAALGWIRELQPKAHIALLKESPKLPADLQALLLEALAGLGVQAVLPVALQGIQGSDPLLQSAGLTALTQLGKAADAQPVVEAMNASSGEMKIKLMDVLVKLASHQAVPSLLVLAEGNDPDSAKAASRALSELVTDADAPQLLARLANPTLANRSDLESVAIKSLARVEPSDRRSPLVQSHFGNASSSEVRVSALRLYRYCADAQALTAVKRVLDDTDPKMREAACRALFDWSNSGAWDTLLQIFQKPEKPSFSVLAWRSLLRLAQEANKEPDEALVARYRQLLTLARNDDERRAVLGALAGCGHLAALELALQQRAVLKDDADAAVNGIADLIRKKHPREVKDALRRLREK